jgi:hypothetical protein
MMTRFGLVLIVGVLAAYAAPAPQPPSTTVAKPSDQARVTAGIAVRSAKAAPGEVVTVFVKARVAEGHWIYAMEKSRSKNIPTRIEDSVPIGFEARGPWRGPAPKVQDGSRILAGDDLLFQRQFRIATRVEPQKCKLRFKLEFQVCNDLVCWPPESIDMEAELEIVRPR